MVVMRFKSFLEKTEIVTTIAFMQVNKYWLEKYYVWTICSLKSWYNINSKGANGFDGDEPPWEASRGPHHLVKKVGKE